MIVTDIIPVDKRRSKVFLNGDFAFCLYMGEIHRFSLEPGEELKEEVLREIDAILRRRAKDRALYYLQSQSRTEMEVRTKLVDGFYPEEIADETVAFLKEYRFLDDSAYVRNYITYHAEKKSKKEMEVFLRKKGISRSLISEAFKECEVDPTEAILRLLRKKHYQKEMSREERQKVAAYVLRKGFSWEEVRQAMTFLDEEEE